MSVVDYLVNHGGDMNVIDDDGMNALWVASAYGQSTIVKYLLERGADVTPIQRLMKHILLCFRSKE